MEGVLKGGIFRGIGGGLSRTFFPGVPNKIAGLRKTIIAHDLLSELSIISKIQQVVYHQCCILIG